MKQTRVHAYQPKYPKKLLKGAALTAAKPDGKRSWTCCHATETLLAGYPHLFYESNPQLIVRFLRKCAERS